MKKATFFGGNGAGQSERVNAIAVHPQTGWVYIVGTTDSTALPGTLVGTQTTKGGFDDAFAARLPADLVDAATVRSTFIGGGNNDSGNALSIDPRSGDVYVAGSTGGGLPLGMLDGAAQATYAGGIDGFVARLKEDLSNVVRATYLGGAGIDEVQSIALHPFTGEILVAGHTTSSAANSNLPQTAAGAQSADGGGRDGFVSRLSGYLATILQTSYLGGTGDECQGSCKVAIHPQSGEVFVAGDTNTGLAPALLVDGIQPGYAGGLYDGFVVRFNAALTQRRAGTHLGGGGFDIGYAIAIEPSGGSVYLAGVADSGFPTTLNPQQSTYGGSRDGLVSRFSTDLTLVNRTPNPFSFIYQSNVPPGTIRTSNEVRLFITPNPGDNHQAAYVTGTMGSELCVANQPGICVTPYVACAPPCFGTNWFVGPWDFVSGDYIAVRHNSSASGTAETKLIISGTAYPFRSSTGNANIACNLDMNADNNLSATLEGLILVRAMLGFSSAAVVAGTGVTQGRWDAMRPAINANCGTNF
ncbi:MAG: hypothetical protein EAZ30_12825 [Betaproteobacteria bacterium]|nr:MAG: hypothetical protein EAZ30_12825 [Betaproteobacteria bacterium]